MAERMPAWYALCAASAAVELACAAAIRVAYGATFAEGPWLGEGTCVGASYAILVVGGVVACALAACGAYAAVVRMRPVWAALAVGLVASPLVLVAVTGVYGALVCLAML